MFLASLRVVAVLALFLASAGCVTPTVEQAAASDAPAEDPRRTSSLLVGGRSFDDDGFGRMEDQFSLGLLFREPLGPDALSFEGSLRYSFDTASDALSTGRGVELKAECYELSAGLAAGPPSGWIRPYVGAGATLLFVQLRQIDTAQDELTTDQDATLGLYLSGGLLFQVSRTAHFGLELRHVEAGDVSLEGDQVDGGFDELVFVLGMGF